MRILVIEDEARIQSVPGPRARGRGVHGGRCRRTAAKGSTWRRGRAGTWSCSTCSCPGSTGCQVLRELHRAKPDLPVVILSARGDVADQAARIRARGDLDYVAKPFSLDELLARIRVRLRARGHLRRRARLCGAATSSSTSRGARRGWASGQQISRTASSGSSTTCSLHAGEVLSRERLLAEVWGYDSIPARTSSTSTCAGCARSSGRTQRSRP